MNKRMIPLLTNTSLMKLLYFHVVKVKFDNMSEEEHYNWYCEFIEITNEIDRRLIAGERK